MTSEELRELFAKISIGYPFKAWGMRVELYRSDRDEFVILVELNKTPDSETGEATRIQALHTAPRSFDHGLVLRWVFEQCARLVKHEMAESFVFDGKRIFDPHAIDGGV